MSAKLKDDKNRWRNKTIAFRASPEEAEELDRRVRLCGARTKQDYILESVLKQNVTAIGNPRMLTQFRAQLNEIIRELRRVSSPDDIPEELFTPIRTMLEILEAFQRHEGGKS